MSRATWTAVVPVVLFALCLAAPSGAWAGALANKITAAWKTAETQAKQRAEAAYQKLRTQARASAGKGEARFKKQVARDNRAAAAARKGRNRERAAQETALVEKAKEASRVEAKTRKQEAKRAATEKKRAATLSRQRTLAALKAIREQGKRREAAKKAERAQERREAKAQAVAEKVERARARKESKARAAAEEKAAKGKGGLDWLLRRAASKSARGQGDAAAPPERKRTGLDYLLHRGSKGRVEAYIEATARKSDLQRQEEKIKTGVFTGGHAINPVNGEKLPIWIADYVLMGYGTGAIMAVPGHDERDWEFARTFDLPIREVVSGGDVATAAFTDTDDGTLVNSATTDGSFSLNGTKPSEAIPRITAWLSERGVGQKAVNYKLRDWLFSRQRYWGEPFPVIWVNGEHRALPEEQLPVLLPETKDFRPAGTGESPLANNPDWVATTDPTSGEPARRETNTMPQWAGSCWYYLRFIDPKNPDALVDPAKEKFWMPVDLYVGGAEHAVLHLLYARFWHKVLYDIGVVSTLEPFAKLVHQGTILGEDNVKMSKSRGNVVSPDEMIDEYGADALRVYEMFMGPLEASKPWSSKAVEGTTRFLDRVWRLFTNEEGQIAFTDGEVPLELQRILHKTIAKITEDLDALKFNTAIAQMMVFVNEVNKTDARPRAVLEPFLLLLSPFAPHLCEELWSRMGHPDTLAYAAWPKHDPALVIDDTVTVAVQINGKLRATLDLARGLAQEAVQEAAFADERVRKYTDGAQIKKVIHVKDKLLNVVVAAG